MLVLLLASVRLAKKQVCYSNHTRADCQVWMDLPPFIDAAQLACERLFQVGFVSHINQVNTMASIVGTALSLQKETELLLDVLCFPLHLSATPQGRTAGGFIYNFPWNFLFDALCFGGIWKRSPLFSCTLFFNSVAFIRSLPGHVAPFSKCNFVYGYLLQHPETSIHAVQRNQLLFIMSLFVILYYLVFSHTCMCTRIIEAAFRTNNY